MALQWFWVSSATLLVFYIFAKKVIRNLNGWYYDVKFRNKEYPLPSGDMGWPIIGNLYTFYKSFSSGQPDSFISNFIFRYGRTGIYKTQLFGSPSIIVCTPEICRRVLTDEVNYKLSYPKATKKLMRSRLDNSWEHRQFKRLVTAPIVGQNALGVYLERIENIVINSLEEMSSVKQPIEFLEEMRKVSFKVIIQIFLGSCNQQIVTKFGDLFDVMQNGLFSLFPIEAPGFSFNNALQARKKVVKIVESLIDERRLMMNNSEIGEKKDIVDILLEIKDDNDEKMKDEDIIDFLIVLLFGGHESVATAMMWSVIYLTQNPQCLKRAKEEQEVIIKARSSSEKRLCLKEIKEMVYLSQVINESLRLTSNAALVFREAASDLNINGYLIPKGWKVLVWLRALHMEPEYHSNAEDFNPSRWDDYNLTEGTFLPFGIGKRLCPGLDLTRFEFSIFLHYFLLNYKLEQINPECRINCIPISRPIDNCLAKVIKLSTS
uniref:Putative cytochrome P450 monooxygenase CYP88D8 n=1 Tax=Astragalus sinicus TaxID=47065 RepID=N0DL42_ASTSI|nr:putative cytochrome P450 monooxygenase CYP88D8 [Astragalus sinicus]